MNQIATQQPKTPMSSVGVSDTGKGSKIAPKDLNEVVKFAEVMSRADIALPKHLRNNPGACMAVAMQALEWELSPFAVASKSYQVNGAIAYEAQLIAAVVNTRSGIKGRLKYRYDGEGGNMTCTVTGILDNEECTYTSPTIGSITTKNSPLWKSDPQQQLGYFSARSWARRHCPEVILGVYDRDETEDFRGPDRAKDITSRVIVDPLNDEPVAPQTFTPEFDEPVDPETGEINPDPGASPPADDAIPVASSQPEDRTPPSGQGQTADPAGPHTSPEVPAGSPSFPAKFEFTASELINLKDFARKGFNETQADKDKPAKVAWLDKLEMDYFETLESVDAKKAFNIIKKSHGYVLNDGRPVDKAREYIAREILDCRPAELEGRGNG